MVAPTGALETPSGYPIIDPDTINPLSDWPNIEQAQADWLDTHTILRFASKADLDIKRPTMPPGEVGFAFTYAEGYHWFYYAGVWRIWSGTSNWASMAPGFGHSVTSGYPLQSRLKVVNGGATVEFTGAVTRGGSGGTLATLGTGHRPGANRWAGGHVASNGIAYELLVQPSGVIGFAAGYASGSVVDGAVIPLSGSFPL